MTTNAKRQSRSTGRMGLQAYATVLAAVWDQPATHEDVLEHVGRGGQVLREILWRMEHLGVVREAEWRQPRARRSILGAAFIARHEGDPPSAPYPRPLNKPSPGSTLARNNPRPELVAFANIVRTLRAGATRAEIREATGVAHHRISALLAVMRRLGIVHRSAWEGRDCGAGMPAEVLKLGRGRDCPRLPTLTEQEKQARYRARRSAREAGRRVTAALAGSERVVAFGPQSYHLLAGVCP